MSLVVSQSDSLTGTNGDSILGHTSDNPFGGTNIDSWQEQIGTGVTIQSNRATSPVAAGTYVNNINATGTDGRVTANVYGVANGVGVLFRFDQFTTKFYGYIGGAANSRLFYFDSSTFNVIATGGPALTDGDKMAIVANGTTITGYLNDVLVLTATGQADIASGKPGTYLGGGSSAFDNFIYETGTLSAATPTNLGITTAPVGNQPGVAYTTQPVIAVRDAGLATVTTDTSTVAASITVLTGSVTLGGTTSKAAVAGVATFTNLAPSGTGSYTMTFSDGALTSVTTGTLYVGATQLAITSVSTPTYSKHPTTVVVTAKDAGGTVVANFTGTVALSLTKLSGGSSVATLTGGTSSAAAVAGVATLTPIATTSDNGLVATSFTYTAGSGTLTPATTATITPTVSESIAVTIT